jgi:outer membrane biosynthesis protein TonB
MGNRVSGFGFRVSGVGTALLLVAVNALAAESFNSRLRQGHALLQQGDPDGALTQYRDLQTEDPESDVLYYSIGCAQCEEGMQAVQQKAPQDALASLETAKASFEKVLTARDPEIRKNAAFNHANTVAQIAMQSAAAQKYEETTKAFEESVKEYEAFLKQHPDHEGAQKNLDHMRYLLKSMLQNPRPPQQQQGQGQPQDQNKQGQPPQDKQQKQEQEEPKPQEGQQPQQAQAQANNQAEQDKQEKSVDEAQSDGRQNVEAILQSLEDVDNKQQQETKNQRTEIKMRREWW